MFKIKNSIDIIQMNSNSYDNEIFGVLTQLTYRKSGKSTHFKKWNMFYR